MKNIFWIHGGPGFNSRNETLTLEPEFKKSGYNTFFWNHPSHLRGSDKSYNWTEYIKDLSEKFESFIDEYGSTVLICHSFGARCSIELLHKFSHRIDKIVWISGALDMLKAFYNIYSFTMLDYAVLKKPEIAGKLKSMLSEDSITMDQYLNEVELVLTNERLALHYWKNHEVMMPYYGNLTEQWSIDPHCLIGVLGSLEHRFDMRISDIPLLDLRGKYEEVVDNDMELATTTQIFNSVITKEFVNSSHFLHLEEQAQFLSALAEFLDDTGLFRETTLRLV